MTEFDDLMAINMNKFYFNELLREISTSQVVPFIGAGMSAPVYPLWKDYILNISDEFFLNKEKITNMLKDFQYEEAMDYIYNLIGERAFYDHISAVYNNEKLYQLSCNNPIWLLTKIFNETVITTNFDNVLEYVYEKSDNKFDDCIYPSQMSPLSHTILKTKHLLIKVHGDINGHSDIILTKNQYDELYGNENKTKFVKFLERFILSKTLLFLGCSIYNDRTIKTLRNIINSYDNVINYAIIERPNDKERIQERTAFLSELGIRPIWYPKGEHQCIKIILNQIIMRLNINSISVKSKEKELLKELVYSGFEYINDCVEITFNNFLNTYSFTFIKHLKILSTKIDRYKTQFYVNKFLYDEKRTLEYYKINRVNWNDLRVRAYVAFKDSDSNKFSEYIEVKTEFSVEKVNYIPFDILFKSNDENRVFHFDKDTEIKVKYTYTASTKIWGSYLNRSNSFFGESLDIIINHDGRLQYEIYEIDYIENSTRRLNEYEYVCDKKLVTKGIREIIKLPERRNGRFKICWDSKKYFGDDINTEVTIDNTEVARHFL